MGRFLFEAGAGAHRRVMHLTTFNPLTGEPTMKALCGAKRRFNRTINVPLRRPICKKCEKAAEAWGA